MKMFKACKICFDNLRTINYPSYKLSVNADKLTKCPLIPTCAGQPERSKREDLECLECEKIKEKVYEEICACSSLIYDYLDYNKMRCSEHCGNTVRDK